MAWTRSLDFPAVPASKGRRCQGGCASASGGMSDQSAPAVPNARSVALSISVCMCTGLCACKMGIEQNGAESCPTRRGIFFLFRASLHGKALPLCHTACLGPLCPPISHWVCTQQHAIARWLTQITARPSAAEGLTPPQRCSTYL